MSEIYSYIPGTSSPLTLLTPKGRRAKPISKRLTNYIPEPNSGCWIWLGAVDAYGYGKITIGNKDYRAHRLSYEFHIGAIPYGLVLDHYKCNTRTCINPHHVKPTTVFANSCRQGNADEDYVISRWKTAKRLRAKGKTLEEVGFLMGVSRQRIDQMLNKAKRWNI